MMKGTDAPQIGLSVHPLLRFPSDLPIAIRRAVGIRKCEMPKLMIGAGYVLEGSVRKAGSRVRITAQLTDTRSGHQVWAEKYDRELSDIFDIQDEVAARVVQELKIEMNVGMPVSGPGGLSVTGVALPRSSFGSNGSGPETV